MKCFLLVPSGRELIFMVTREVADPACPATGGQHCAKVRVGECGTVKDADGVYQRPKAPAGCVHPVKCDCGHEFTENAIRTQDGVLLWRADDGAVYAEGQFPPGAMWNRDELTDHAAWTGPDGQALHLVLPNGDHWHIDGRARNCDSPCKTCGKPYHAHKGSKGTGCESFKESKPHKCWVRHGVPPELTVDKKGVTCGAGAGSISVTGWHGFLRDGFLVV